MLKVYSLFKQKTISLLKLSLDPYNITAAFILASILKVKIESSVHYKAAISS